MARSAKILGKFSLKLAKMGKNSLKYINFPIFSGGGGQAKICGTYADLVGTKKADLQIFSLVLQIFSMRHNGEILIFSRKSTSKMDRLSRF